MSQQPDLAQERRLWARGMVRIAGLDEAGRGAWAGPVVAAACILPPDEAALSGALAIVRDSKLLSPARRERAYELVVRLAVTFGVGAVSADEIDAIGIVPATRKAMTLALAGLSLAPQHLLIDALRLPDVPLPQTALIKGDRFCLSIAAASILAKVTRDRMMVALERTVPGYEFARHKGYGTAAHRRALVCRGASRCHRMSFAPLRLLAEEEAPVPSIDGEAVPTEACHG